MGGSPEPIQAKAVNEEEDKNASFQCAIQYFKHPQVGSACRYTPSTLHTTQIHESS